MMKNLVIVVFLILGVLLFGLGLIMSLGLVMAFDDDVEGFTTSEAIAFGVFGLLMMLGGFFLIRSKLKLLFAHQKPTQAEQQSQPVSFENQGRNAMVPPAVLPMLQPSSNREEKPKNDESAFKESRNSIRVTKASSVKSIKWQFREVTGASLRIYNGARFADDDQKITDLSKSEDPRGELKLAGNTKVANVERFFMETFGIKVQLANASDTKLAPNDYTLARAKDL